MNMFRAIAFVIAVIVGVGGSVVAFLIGNVLAAYFLGLFAGSVVVLANVLTHPLLFGWRR